MDRIAKARLFRQADLLAETRLWAMVRGRRLNGYKFRRQVPLDRFFADFACMQARLIVEVDGPSHDDQADHDEARTQVLEGLGFTVLRVTNAEVLGDPSGVAIKIGQALAQSRPSGGFTVRGSSERP